MPSGLVETECDPGSLSSYPWLQMMLQYVTQQQQCQWKATKLLPYNFSVCQGHESLEKTEGLFETAMGDTELDPFTTEDTLRTVGET